MTPKEFYNAYSGYAKQSEAATKVPYLFTLAQASLESGWGKAVKGNNFFGIKDTDGINGNEQEFWTTEFNRKKGIYYKVRQWFRKYKTPADSFTDQGNFLRKNKRYAGAFSFTDPVLFAREVAKAQYATDPKYFEKISTVIGMLRKIT